MSVSIRHPRFEPFIRDDSAASGHTPPASEARFRISLIQPFESPLFSPSNRRSQTHEGTANEHHGGFIPEPGSLPRNRGNRNRRGHRGTGCIGLTGSDCRRRRNQSENRQAQKPPTHKVEPRSPLVDGTPRPSTLDKLQSMCHGGALSNFGQNTAFARRGSIQSSKLAERYPNVPKRESQ